MSLVFAKQMDEKFPSLKNEFVFPEKTPLYFAGHSLGLMPKKTAEKMQSECETWGRYGVEGHFEGPHPWKPYHEEVTAPLARLVGAKESEVVAMNSLTVNLHLMLVSFYQPKGRKNKIVIEPNTFPSDKYAVDSQAAWHGLDPKTCVVEAPCQANSELVDEEALCHWIQKNRDELALVLLGDCNYLSGQKFNLKKLANVCKQNGVVFGVNLAHGAGNLAVQLHDDEVDFAVWCSYKYLNSGPGGIAGCFVHERHHKTALPRFAGWWGHNKSTRFQMGPNFEPIDSVEAWQLSNPPIFQLAALKTSLDLYDRMGMAKLRERGDHLTQFLFERLQSPRLSWLKVATPVDSRGSMLSLRILRGDGKVLQEKLKSAGASVDFRFPNVLRATPSPLYNTFQDVEKLATLLEEFSV